MYQIFLKKAILSTALKTCAVKTSVNILMPEHINTFLLSRTVKNIKRKAEILLQLVLGQKASDNFTKRIEELPEEAKAIEAAIENGPWYC